MKRIWRNKWFYLVSVIALFWMVSYVRVVYAGTDVQLDKVLKAGVDGFVAFLNWLLDVLKLIW